MRIFLATTSIEEIKWATNAGLIDGVVAKQTSVTVPRQ